MSQMDVGHEHPGCTDRVFTGAAGNRLVASVFGTDGLPVLLLHGGGQTRHAWRATARSLSSSGWTAITVDLRGHGDSEWVADRSYHFDDFAADAGALLRSIGDEFSCKPVAIGASLGGISSLLAQHRANHDLLSALVLVDVTPRMRRDGVDRIIGFMSERMEEGFESLQEAADVIGSYLPNRARSKSLDGLSKNLRLDADGRYRWHWDPAMIDGLDPARAGRSGEEGIRVEAARSLSVPTLLVHGQKSELVTKDHAREFLELVPHARVADVSGAGHMIAGDRNDLFKREVTAFLDGLGLQQSVSRTGIAEAAACRGKVDE